MKLLIITFCICFVAYAFSNEDIGSGTSTEEERLSSIFIDPSANSSLTTLSEANSSASNTATDEDGATIPGSSSSPTLGVNSSDESTIYDQDSTSNEVSDSDTIIVFSTILEDKNSTNGTDSTITYVENSTLPITTVEEDIKEINDSMCFNNPCKNGGTCMETPYSPYISCECASGYVGIRCGTVDKCIYYDEGQACKNGFCSYTEDGRETFCDCFAGDYWDSDANECREIKTVCDNNPCENGGKCNPLPGNNYNCTCKAGFSGKSCEVTHRCITDDDCGHGMCGLSEDKKTRSCRCEDGYYAQNDPHTCKAITTPCDAKPCHNGGVCNWFDTKTYNCTCQEGYSGKACEIEDRCASDEDCGHGVCTLHEETKTRSCKCSDGYYPVNESSTCQKISNVCQPNPCLHEGICTVLSTKEYNCTCSDGFTGKNCDTRDMCVMDGGNAYCNGATCQNNQELGIYYCLCSAEQYFQYTERKCVEVDLCPLMQCESNQKCSNGECVCKENYKNSTGKCEPDFCSKKPCPLSGMLCEEGTSATDYKCSCEEGYTFNGTHCNEALCIFPQLNPCQQHCTVLDGGYECSCDEDFELRNDNKTCELKGNNTCQVKVCDKGSCALKSEEVCICPPGYIEVDGNCTDICTAAKISPSICPDGCEMTPEGGFRCKCKGKLAHAEDKTTCVVRNMCQENEAGWKKCREKNALCIQSWNETEGFTCKCQNGYIVMEDGICRDVCSIESNQRMCSLKGGTCEVDRKGNVTCKCPPYFQLNEKDGKCSKPADVSYLITLPLDLSTYTTGANRKRRSLDVSVDYKKISMDVKITIEDMFVGYKWSNVLYCNPTSDYILCKIELQFETQHETQLKRLGTEDICLTEENAKKCLLPPALVLVKERISQDFIIEPTDPCEDFIKEENCGSETTCASFLSKKSFNCTCKPGFEIRKKDYSFGSKSVVELCRDINECIENPCMENSICVNTIGSYNCICKAGFRRELSDSDHVKCVEICSPNPCTHGMCSKTGDHGFDCKCDAGYRGALCDLQDENFKRERNNSIILGVVLGGILLITFILFAVCVSRLRKRKCMENPNIYYDSTEMKERGRINNAFQRE